MTIKKIEYCSECDQMTKAQAQDLNQRSIDQIILHNSCEMCKQQAIDETVPHCDIEEATSNKR